MPWVGFEPTILAGERPKTYALDRMATGTGNVIIYIYIYIYIYMCVCVCVCVCLLTDTNMVTMRNMNFKSSTFIVIEIWKLFFVEILRRNTATNGRSMNF